MSRTLASLGLFLLLGGCSEEVVALAVRPPNVVVLLADDFGFECLGANHAASFRTPALDTLAQQGVRFTSCFAQPNCTPTRVQLLSGCSNVRNYTDFAEMDPSIVTFAHLFRDAGYATGIAGKWQLGMHDPELPRHFGFDEHCLWGLMGRGERYRDPTLTIAGVREEHPGEYGPDVCQRFALDFVRRHRDQPFLLFLPLLLAHPPFEPTPGSPGYGKTPARSAAQVRRTFGDMVSYVDRQAGELLQELTSLGLREDTLVIFLGDNGTGRAVHAATPDADELAGEKGSTTRAGMHVPLIASWPRRGAANRVCDDLIDTTDLLPTLCAAAGVPLRPGSTIDGRSFLPQLEGLTGEPRDDLYSYWVPLRSSQAAHVGDRGAVEQAFDHRFKRYSTGEFFDLDADPEEEQPLGLATLRGEAAAHAARLGATLERFRDARPAALSPPPAPRAQRRSR